ncbi:MAG: nuclear transport factor 2 family protein [Anaerolineales bacterium]|nr:nuclear transport factor 2 family protein [Anaerolineales bacterium]MCB9129187.1 nuclear transport factor 2 family protein [Ardenticatenales bacterium]
MSNKDYAARVRDYVTALNNQDLDHCLALYTDDAVIHFQPGIFRNKSAVEEWHKGRFKAELEIIDVKSVESLDENTVVLQGAATSKRLKRWRINQLQGTATFSFDPTVDKVRELRFALSGQNFLEGW